jgi:hypothetical protein
VVGFLGICQAFAYDVLCHNGNTAFQAHFHTGVLVKIGPLSQGELAVRSCRAVLGWDDQELVVANDAAEIDLDMFGVDAGTGEPVAAFQVKQTESECCMRYLIYSLQKPPQLLRTIAGGGYFNAADTDLDGQVEIWTSDSGAVDRFEGWRASEIKFPPPCVMRFQQGGLLDVSSEFQRYFDENIAQIRAGINPREAQEFKDGGGQPATRGGSYAAADTGRRPGPAVKLQILELAWMYLYSHRERQAWQTMAELWPAGDRERIRAALLRMRSRGVLAQVDGVSAEPPPESDSEHAKIYDSTTEPAQPIMLRFYPSNQGESLRGKVAVELVVDSAGKVWSAKVRGKAKAGFQQVKRSTTYWKFIPAFVDERPVASRVRMTITLQR